MCCRGASAARAMLAMPTISRFYGIVIRMYFANASGEILRGGLPDRAVRLVREWASIHRDELAANWERIQVPEQPAPIAPLP